MLESLIKLFAISTNKDSVLAPTLVIEKFRFFLSSTIEDKFVDEFAGKFISALDQYASFSNKRLSLNSVRLIKICNETGKILSRDEKIQVVFYLCFLLQDNDNQQTKEFIDLVADVYQLENSTYKDICNLFRQECTNAVNIVDNQHIVGCYLVLSDNIVAVKSYGTSIKINNEQIGKTVRLISLNSVVVIGERKFYFSDFIEKQDETNDNFHILVDNISVEKQGNILLKPLSCRFTSGELIGVIGKSGAGKTTFLKALAGVNKHSGSVCRIDKNGIASPHKAYLAQANCVIPLFSVSEHLAQRLDFLQKKVNKQTAITEVLNEVGLADFANNIVAKADGSSWQISGGQQKRLGIAMEMLAEPEMLVLDEPTSGLSSADAHSIVALLRRIATKQKVVVASIHQPDYETLMMFDKIIIIDNGGYLIYCGRPSNAANYFRQHTNKIDKASLLETHFNTSIILDLIGEKDSIGKRCISPEEWHKKWKEANSTHESTSKQQSCSCNSDILRQTSCKPQNSISLNAHFLSLISEFKFVFLCDIKNKLRLLLIIGMPLLMSCLMSLLTRYSLSTQYAFYSNPNIPAWLMMLLISGFFIGLVTAGHEFIFLRQFHRNEHIIRNKTIALTFAKIIKYLAVSAVISLLLTFPATIIEDCNFLFPLLFVTNWLLIFCGNLLSMLLSLFFKSISLVYLIIPLIVIPQMIFSGGLIRYEHFNKLFLKADGMPLFANIMPIRWADEACLTGVFMQNPVEKEIFELKQQFYQASINGNIEAKQKLQNIIDKHFSRIISADSLNMKYSNMYVTKIVSSNVVQGRETANASLPAIYSIQDENSIFLCGQKMTLGRKLDTFCYNTAIMLIYNFVLSILLLVSARLKN